MRRDFTAPAPNRLWVTDLTMIPTGEGPLWLSAIRDAYSRRVVAWETSARADADLVLTSLEYALASRGVAPGQLVHHADHGCQYTSIKLTTRRLRPGIESVVVNRVVFGGAGPGMLVGLAKPGVPAAHRSSCETITPRCSISSSASRNESGKRKYSHTQWEMTSTGYRCLLYAGDTTPTTGPPSHDRPEDHPTSRST